MTWNLTDAESRLGEVLTEADTESQVIVRRDREYVLMTADEYRRLKQQDVSFTDFLINAGPRFDDLEPMKRPAVRMRDLPL